MQTLDDMASEAFFKREGPRCLSPMLRIAMISPLPPQRTGESSYAAELIHGLDSIGNIRVLAITGRDAKPLSTEMGKTEIYRIWNGRSLMYPLGLLRAISRMRPHIVHVQFGPHGKVYGGFFGEPMLFLLILLKALGIRTTMTLHSTWMREQVKERVRVYRAIGGLSVLAPALFRIYMRLLDFGTSSVQLSTVKTGSTLRERFLEEWSFQEKKTLEIPMPCRLPRRVLDRGQALQTLGLSGKKVILVFGFIRRGKGLETALLAMNDVRKVVRDSVLLIAGAPLDKDDSAYLTELHESTSSLSLNGTVRFDTKFIPEDEVPTYMSAASVILLPYMESVGASGPAHNAAGYGVPIVASNTGHHMRESLGGGLVLFQAGHPEDMADKLVHVLSDTDSALRIGERLKQYAKTETWALAVKRTLTNYRKTMTLP